MRGFHRLDTTLGAMRAAFDADGGLIYLGFAEHEFRASLLAKLASLEPTIRPDAKNVGQLLEQIETYAAGYRRTFEIPLRLRGTPFEQRVWTALQRIPYGETRSYGQLAAQMGDPNLSRAVGRANGANPVSILVPCHRVIGANGALIGYAGGLDLKARLLELEASHTHKEL